MMQLGMKPYPVQSLRAPDHLNLNARLFEQRSRLQCALPHTDDDNLLPLKLSQIVMLTGVRSQGGRNPSELCRASCKRADSTGDYDTPRREFLAIGQNNPKTGTSKFNAMDLTPI